MQRRQQELERLEAAKRERMRSMSAGLRPGYGMGGPTFQQEPIIDGPMGRNPPTFGGARPGTFSNNYSGPPPPLGGPPQRPPPTGISYSTKFIYIFL